MMLLSKILGTIIWFLIAGVAGWKIVKTSREYEGSVPKVAVYIFFGVAVVIAIVFQIFLWRI